MNRTSRNLAALTTAVVLLGGGVASADETVPPPEYSTGTPCADEDTVDSLELRLHLAKVRLSSRVAWLEIKREQVRRLREKLRGLEDAADDR